MPRSPEIWRFRADNDDNRHTGTDYYITLLLYFGTLPLAHARGVKMQMKRDVTRMYMTER